MRIFCSSLRCRTRENKKEPRIIRFSAFVVRLWFSDRVLNMILFFISTVQSTMCKIPHFCWPLSPSFMSLLQSVCTSEQTDIIKLARADHWPALKGLEELFSPAGLSIKVISANMIYMSTPFPAIHLQSREKWKICWGQTEMCIKPIACLSRRHCSPCTLKKFLLCRPAALITVWSCKTPQIPSES